MTTKQLIQQLSKIDEDLETIIHIDLHGQYQGLQSFEVNGETMNFSLLSWTTHLKPEDVVFPERSASPWDRQLQLRTRVGNF